MSWDDDDGDWLDGFTTGLLFSPIGFWAYVALAAAVAALLWLF
jgi:hypothetical protein